MCKQYKTTKETGGVAILVVLILLSIATVGAMSLSRGALREALITGNESTGRKAYELADSGLDYLITWSNSSYASAPTDTAKAIANKYQDLLNAIDPADNDFSTSGLMSADGSIRAEMKSTDSAFPDLNPTTTGQLQTNSVVKPAFDLELWYLGHPYSTAKTKGPAFFLVRSTGRANIGSTGQSFISRREALIY